MLFGIWKISFNLLLCVSYSKSSKLLGNMVSDASKKKAAQKKAAAAAKRGSKSVSVVATSSKTSDATDGTTNGITDEMMSMGISDRTCTGILTSHALSRDIHVRVHEI
jgi:ATP-binding cassette subfamily F protein 2